MATKRQKKTVITGVTREQAEDAFAQYSKADAQIEKINAGIDLQVAKLREKHQAELAALAKEKDEAFETLDSYARENKAELFAKKKSFEMVHGIIGFRTGTPKLKTLKGFTWASALTLVKKYMPGYVRTTEEIAKDQLLADRDMEAVDFIENGVTKKVEHMSIAMAECGIMVTQEETFYVETKKEDNMSE